MSIEALGWAIKQMNAGTIPAITRYVLLFLANRADPEGACFPSVKYMVRVTGLSDTTVRRACRDLATLGLLEVVEQRRIDGTQSSNLYRLRLELAQQTSAQTPPPGSPTGRTPAVGQGDPGAQTGHDTKMLYKVPPDGGVGGEASNGEVIEKIPLAGGAEWGATKDYVAELERAFPRVDGAATLREIRAWCVSNPTLCKTQRGVRRFVHRWFEKEQNKPVRP